MSNLPATMDDALLAELAGMTKKEEIATGETGPAVLKINYDEESVHGLGVWVIGQKKKDNAITEQGHMVNSMIILATKLQHSYYDEKNPSSSFSTQMFDWGGKAPDKADFDARLASIGKADKGRFRVVCFGLAILPDGSTVDCVSYMAGTTYPEFKSHLESITRQKLNGQWHDLPPFVCVTTLLPTQKEKNGSRSYYIGKFEAGPFLQRDMIIACSEKREEVYEYIDNFNANNNLTAPQQAPPAPSAPQAPPAAPQYQAPAQQQPVMPTNINIGSLKSANPARPQAQEQQMPSGPPVGDDVPFDMPGAGVGDLDLEAAINSALEG